MNWLWFPVCHLAILFGATLPRGEDLVRNILERFVPVSGHSLAQARLGTLQA